MTIQPQPADLSDADLVDQFAAVRDKMGTDPDCAQNDVWVQQSNQYRIALLSRLARVSAPPSGQVCITLDDAQEISAMIRYTMTSYKRDQARSRLSAAIVNALKGASE